MCRSIRPRIEIKPQGDAILQVEQPIVLTALPVDGNGNVIQGLVAEWESSDASIIKINKGGQAVGMNVGTARLTATAGNKRETLRVTVVPSTGRFGGVKPDSVRLVAGFRKNSKEAKLTARLRAVKQREIIQRAHKTGAFPSPLPPRLPDEDPLPDGETGSLYNPGNSVGSPPGRTIPGAPTRPAAGGGTEIPGSDNFTFGVPIVDIPGRGLDVSLGLTYNSRLWNRSMDSFALTHLTFDVDSGWPAAGWRLGYGQMESQGSQGFTLTDPNGTRHQMVKVDPLNPSDYNYDSTDGTFIRFEGGLSGGTVTYTNGTRVLYGGTGNGGQPSGPRSYPIRVTDSSGNYIQIAYVNNQGPQISSIQDTLGRYVQFNYSGGDLVSITAPGYAENSDREVIRLYYEDISVAGDFQNFCSTCIHGVGSTRVIRYLYVPNDTANTGMGFRYDYSAYGMIRQIVQLREMHVDSVTKALTDYGQQASSTLYNYPPAASALTDVPIFTTRTDDWAGRTSAQPVYTFSKNETEGTTTTTAPDTTITETKTYINSAAWKNGLLKEITVKKPGVPILARTFMDWDHDGTLNNARLTNVEVTNEAEESRRTTYDYTSYNNVSVVSERDFAPAGTLGAELRRTETTYEEGTNWTNRRLVHLPKIVRVYDASTVVARTDFNYDGDTLTNLLTLAEMHDQTYNSHSASYDSATGFRGNLTSVTSYADADAVPPSNPMTNTMKYDIVGNVVEQTVNCCRRKTFSYSGEFKYAYPTTATSGDAGQMSVTADYDFKTGVIRSYTDENLQTTTIHYFSQTLRYYLTAFPDLGYSAIDYNDGLVADPDASHMHSLTMMTVGTGVGTAMHSYDFYDGRGAIVRHFDDYSAVDGGNSISDIEYDVMGRAQRVSNPYYGTSGNLSLINPSQLWTTHEYDDLGRVKRVILPDGNTIQNEYAGTITTVTDQAGKKRRQKMDALGRVVRMDEPDNDGQLGVSLPNQPTEYEYDKLDNLVHVTQAGPNNVTQHRYLKYDSLSRLTHERQVEQAAPHPTTDSVAGNNLWSKKFVYDSLGLLTDVYDARQVHTHMEYDGLKRVTGITYAGETAPTQTAAVTYIYDQLHTGFHNKARLTEVRTAATANAPATIQAYDYDKMGRVKNHSQTVGSNVPYTTAYGYNIAGWLISQTYPSGKVVSYSYDEVARLSSAKDTTDPQTPKTYISSLNYAAHGGMLGATQGNGTIETVGYNNRLQPTSLTLSKVGNTIQRYDYKYGQVDQSTGAVDETKNNGQIGRIEGYIGSTRQWQQRFSYDPIGRLSTAGEYLGDATLALTHQSNFSYDRFGNRKQKAAQNSQSLAYIQIEDADIDPATNRLTSNTTFDPAGNVEVDQKFRGLRYKYDANGRVWRSANIDNTGEAISVYDAFGQRVQTTAGGNTKTMVYDAFGRMVAEYDSQTQTGGGGTKYLMSDLQGSERVLTSNTGTVMARHDYQAFGGEIGANVGPRTPEQKYNVSDSTRQRYALTERDGTGLDHTWWRKYESSAGRWTSPDPYKGSMSIGDPQSFNRYSYVQNDPVNFVDPSGLCIFNITIANRAGLTDGAMRAMKNEIIRIFLATGNFVVFNNPSAANGGSYTTTQLPTDPGGLALGETRAPGGIVRADGGVYIGALRNPSDRSFRGFAQHPTNLGRAAGRVAAHEAGHYFLQIGQEQHTAEGLMRRQIRTDRNLYQNALAETYRFSQQQAQQLRNLCAIPIEQSPSNIDTGPIPLRPLLGGAGGRGGQLTPFSFSTGLVNVGGPRRDYFVEDPWACANCLP